MPEISKASPDIAIPSKESALPPSLLCNPRTRPTKPNINPRPPTGTARNQKHGRSMNKNATPPVMIEAIPSPVDIGKDLASLLPSEDGWAVGWTPAKAGAVPVVGEWGFCGAALRTAPRIWKCCPQCGHATSDPERSLTNSIGRKQRGHGNVSTLIVVASAAAAGRAPTAPIGRLRQGQ